MTIGSEDELRAKFGEVSHLAAAKSRPALDKYSRQFISLSPFLVISTADTQGRADLSPRGDPPGFVQVIDDNTILIPDRPGNNRLDTMANIMANPNVGLLFFVPGFEDTLRLNGKARITDDAALLSACTVSGKAPKVGMLVTVEEVFLHCAKALKRSRLWDPDSRQDRAQMPSIARIILEQTCTPVAEPEVEKIDAAVEEEYRTALY
jgi:PPOX class probable FMN-dependent enzyme